MILFFLTLVLPFLFIKGCVSESEPGNHLNTEDLTDPDVTILRVEKNGVETIPMDNYIKGVLAYYLNNDFHEETFKAMAVLIRTYAYYYDYSLEGNRKTAHPQYQLCDDDRCCPGYTDDWYMNTKFPYETTISSLEKAQFAAKINRAVEETRNEVITYNGQLILPRFFYASWGTTESYSNVYGDEVKYLASAASPENAPEPFSQSGREFASEDFVLLMKAYYPDIELTKSKLSEQIKITDYNDSGSVASVVIGNKQFTGLEISTAFALNSNCYKIAADSKKVIFTVYGYGDGIGLSLYGADYLAAGDNPYTEIIKQYFYGTSVVHYYTNK